MSQADVSALLSGGVADASWFTHAMSPKGTGIMQNIGTIASVTGISVAWLTTGQDACCAPMSRDEVRDMVRAEVAKVATTNTTDPATSDYVNIMNQAGVPRG